MSGEHDVGGFEIAMDDATTVSSGQSGGDLCGRGDRLMAGKLAALQAMVERLAFEQFHDEITESVLVAEGVDGADVRVGELREGVGFAFEAVGVSGRPEGGVADYFNGDAAVELGVIGFVHVAHATRTEGSGYLVMSKSLADERQSGFALSTSL
ncbi:MAG: hypothetical protein NVS9B15_07960 [Acidobacteriaceae bacterium]